MAPTPPILEHPALPSPPPVWPTPPSAGQPPFAAPPGGGFLPPAPIPPRHARRRIGAALVVVASIAGGAVAGTMAADRHTGSTATTSATTLSLPSSPRAGSVEDVSALVASTLPSVVSIEVSSSSAKAAGTGFVIQSDGEIATNAHVVDGFDKISVTLADGSAHDAKVLGVDRTDDLAVVKIDVNDLPALTLGDTSTLRVGEPVVAIGNALALTGGPTATSGIVSALDRSIDTDNGEHLGHLIQTDAAINPGNSGGPLLTSDGKVVGINSAGSTAAQNIGFAISIDQAKPIIAQLQDGKTVTKAYLGVSTQQVDSSVAEQAGLSVDHGLVVVDVAGESGAADAGLQPGDVLVSANGTKLDDQDTLRDVISAAGPGGKLSLEVVRGAKHLTVSATLSSHAA